jgi:hypothetical protein
MRIEATERVCRSAGLVSLGRYEGDGEGGRQGGGSKGGAKARTPF